MSEIFRCKEICHIDYCYRIEILTADRAIFEKFSIMREGFLMDKFDESNPFGQLLKYKRRLLNLNR